MAKKSVVRNFSCVLDYKRWTKKLRAGFRTEDMSFNACCYSKSKGLWICQKELIKIFPYLKESKKIKLLVSTVAHDGYSNVEKYEESSDFIIITVNNEASITFVDKTIVVMLEKLLDKWGVNILYFKFNRMD